VRRDNREAEPCVVSRHNVYTDATRFFVSLRRNGLGDASNPSMTPLG
jgi:hypothetical protein